MKNRVRKVFLLVILLLVISLFVNQHSAMSGYYNVRTDLNFDWICQDNPQTLTQINEDDSHEYVQFDLDNFRFYGERIEKMRISSNGYIVLEPRSLNDEDEDEIFEYEYENINFEADPNYPYSKNRIIAPYWDDLNPVLVSKICANYVEPSDPNDPRLYIIQWDDIARYQGSVEERITFQVVLEEGTNKIIFQYKDVAIGSTGAESPHDNGRGASVGIQNDNADIGLSYLFEIVENGN